VGPGAGWGARGSLPDPAHPGPICEKSRFQDTEPTLLHIQALTNWVNQVLHVEPPSYWIMGVAVRGGRLGVVWSPPALAAFARTKWPMNTRREEEVIIADGHSERHACGRRLPALG
jgi:hypothetical protein